MIRKQKDNIIMRFLLCLIQKFDSRAAYTIAEVLVTLLIVGVIAAIVIPPLVNDARDKEFVVLYKKDYSLVSAWFSRTVSETGSNIPVLVNFWDVDAYLVSIVQYFPDYIVAKKRFYSGQVTDYYNPGVLRWSSGRVLTTNEQSHWPHPGCYLLNLTNGSTIIVMQWSVYLEPLAPVMTAKSGLLGWFIMIDVNGSRPPNIFGKDIFVVMPYSDGVIKPYISTVACGSGYGQGCSGEKLDD